ncbi:MAG: TRAP transporter large permease subunit [Lentisphaeria bacterium]|nr:TRAP transporter large permease subunit [Lentisphaeria bacterium]
MFFDLVGNPVVISVAVLLILSAIRLNVVFALILASIVGGAAAGLGCPETMKAFLGAGLANGAKLAFNYAMLGAFSIAISRSGITELLTQALFKRIGGEATPKQVFAFKYTLLLILTLAAVSSQNLVPVHIAFIPVLIPPLLPIFEKIRLDRRAVACILTFGLITPYMVMPFGFGRIYLNDILIANIVSNGVSVTADMAPRAMFIPALGMVAGLLIAVFFSYRKPRDYDEKKTEEMKPREDVVIRPWKIIVGIVAIILALIGQIWMDSLVLAALAGILVFVISGVISLRGTQDIFVRGVNLMGSIGIIMIAANGFAEVMKSTGSVETLVELVSSGIGEQRAMAVFLMLLIGLIITMGIGSSFSTVPLIAAIYVPLCVRLGISPLAIIAIVGTAGALGDAGSPVSESVLGPTAGLNADGQHDHIYDSTIPTFIHYNLPLLAAGWIAGMVL